MDINVIDFFKDIKHFEYYFSNRNLILGLMIVGFVILSVCLAEEIVNDFMSCHQTAHTNCHQIA